MKRKLMLLMTFLVIGIGLVNAQVSKVTGTVTSEEDGLPVVGASVLVKGTTVGTVTDIDGNFTINNVPSPAKTLVVSFIGLESQEVTIKPTVKVVLRSDSEQLDEVMVVAYGGATKRSFTGSATEIGGEQISLKNPTELSKALAGEVAGVQVMSTSGQPGSNASIRIRGLGSAYSSRSPLYVVDGIPFEADLSGIDPSDIASMTVLKDATATALYGSRAANGVVLITTKKGEAGKTRVDAEVKYGANMRLTPLYDVIDSPERFTELTWEGLRGYGEVNKGYDRATAATWASQQLFGGQNGIAPIYNMWNADGDKLIDPSTGRFYSGITRKYTPEKWEDYLFRTGQKFDASLKISGGNEKMTHYTAFSYLKDEGYYISSDYERFNVRNNMSNQIAPWLKATTSLSYAYMVTNKPGQSDSNMNNGFQFINGMPSLFPVFERDENGNIVQDTSIGGNKYDYGMNAGYSRPFAAGINPAGALLLDKDEIKTHQFNGNASFEARFLKHFKATANVGLQYYGQAENELTNPYYGDSAGKGQIVKTQVNYLNFTANQILSWTQSFGRNNFEAFVAHESTNSTTNVSYGAKSKMVRPDNTEWSNAVMMDYMESYTYGYAIESYFGQLRYDWDNKYFIHGTLRADGSSRFAKGHKWGTFGSIGTAWAITNEEFMKDIKWLKNLKYKLSWGVLGNQDFITNPVVAGYYPYEDLYQINNLNDNYTFSFVYKGNPDLTWERSSTINTGIEFDIAGILEGEVEYFHKKTTDMLFMKQVAPSLGYASYPVNDGELVNQGVEFSLTAHLLNKKDYKFDFRVNGGYYKNEMTKMPIDETTGKEKALELSTYYGWAKGHSLYDFYMREYAGVDPQTGYAMYNQYYNVLPDGTKELITDMETYKSTKAINKLEVEQTSDWSQATKKFVDKSAIPALQGGFGFDLYAKGFTLNATFSYSLGGYGYDYNYQALMNNDGAGQYNWHKDIENRWQQPGDITDVPRLTSNYGGGADGTSYANATSTRFLTSRSYLNLSNLRLGYTFPQSITSKLHLGGLSVYVSGDNLFFLSARKGYVANASSGSKDTVNNDNNNDSGESGRSQYSPLSTIMGGIKVQF